MFYQLSVDRPDLVQLYSNIIITTLSGFWFLILICLSGCFHMIKKCPHLSRLVPCPLPLTSTIYMLNM